MLRVHHPSALIRYFTRITPVASPTTRFCFRPCSSKPDTPRARLESGSAWLAFSPTPVPPRVAFSSHAPSHRCSLGFAYGNTSNLPVGRGFDQWMGTPATHCESGGPYPPEQLFKNTNRVGWLNVDVDVDYLTENYTTFAVDFMNASVAAGKPFFLYAAFDNTHSQVYYSPRFAGASRRGPFGDATMELDWAVGQIMDSVEALGVRNNTVVVFTSDNVHRASRLAVRVRRFAAVVSTLVVYVLCSGALRGEQGAWSVLTPQQGALPSNFIGQWASKCVCLPSLLLCGFRRQSCGRLGQCPAHLLPSLRHLQPEFCVGQRQRHVHWCARRRSRLQSFLHVAHCTHGTQTPAKALRGKAVTGCPPWRGARHTSWPPPRQKP